MENHCSKKNLEEVAGLNMHAKEKPLRKQWARARTIEDKKKFIECSYKNIAEEHNSSQKLIGYNLFFESQILKIKRRKMLPGKKELEYSRKIMFKYYEEKILQKIV